MATMTFCGAAQTVTGSCHLLEVAGRRYLLDCGLYQGRRKQAFQRNRNFPFEASSIDAVLLSHAHIDHCGNLPSLVRAGFKGKIYATAAAADLARVLLMDSAQIQESDVRYVNKLRKKQGKRPFEPLYQQADARETLNRLTPVDYLADIKISDQLTAQYFDAGHMLGSASIRLEIREEQQSTSLVFSGDVGRRDTAILRDPEAPPAVDWVLMESTYGDRRHPAKSDVRDTLRKAVHHAYDQKGKLIIPAFSVGRTQEVVYRLNELYEQDHLPEIPVFLDSPLATEAMAVFKSHPECFDEETLKRISTEADQDPLGFAHFHYVESVEQSKRLNRAEGPFVVISASGMCESGRVLHHLKHGISDPSTTILFSGYQAPHTLGRRILEGQPFVPLLGQEAEVKASIARLEGMSGHADQLELCEWLDALSDARRPSGVRLVHGEPKSSSALTTLLRERGYQDVEAPAPGDTWQLLP